MDANDKTIIQENLDRLIKLTNVSGVFLAFFVSRSVFGQSDVDRIKIEERKSGNFRATALFYDILITRTSSFEVLLDALRQTNQTRALSVLVQYQSEPKSNRFPKIALHGQCEARSDPVFPVQNGSHVFPNQESDSVTPEHPTKEIDSTIFEENVNGLANLLNNGQKSTILIGTLDSVLTISKIKSSVSTEMHVEELRLWNSVKLLFTGLPKRTPTQNKLSLIVFHDNNQNDSKGKHSFSKQALNILRMRRQLKSIQTVFVLKEDIEALQRYATTCFRKTDNVALLLDTFSWKDLTIPWQHKLLAREVLDQAHQKTLLEFCNSFKYEDQNKFQQSFLNGRLLVDLINYKELPILFRQTIPPVCHYVDRRLRSRFNLSRSIFQLDTPDDIFVLENFPNIDHVKQLAKPCVKKIDTAGNQLVEETITATYILTEYQNDFKVICQKSRKSTRIHFIRQLNGNLVWQQTVGQGIQVLQSCVCADKLQTQIPEDAIFDLLERRNEKDAFIISDSPGMGKSVLLAKLARETKKRYPRGTFVFYFVMTDFIASVTKQQSERGKDPNMLDTIIKEEIIRNCSNYELDSSILTAKESPPLYIFFDGLDELSSDSVDLALTCFHQIKLLFSRARLHVTTRPHLMQLLERTLGTFVYNLEPFNKKDQVDFLTRQWSSIRHEPKLDLEKLQIFAQHCLLALETSLSQTEKSIAGIPLQCLLISEVFGEEALKFADSENQQLVQTVKPRIHVKSVTELYGRLVNRKFMAFRRTYLASSNASTPISALRDLHVYISIQVIMGGLQWNEKLRPLILSLEMYSNLKHFFPEWETSFEEFQTGLLPRRDILAIGLLEEIDIGHWHFIHRTFAEYFIADFAAGHINQNSQQIIEFLKEAVLATTNFTVVLSKNLNLQQNSFKFKYPVICHFLNTMIKTGTGSLLKLCLDNVKQACINDNFVNLYKILVSRVNQHEPSQLKESILLASRKNSIEILQWIEFHKSPFHQFYPTVLDIAVEHGHKSLVSYILNDCIPDDIVQNLDKKLSEFKRILPNISNFLPFCLANTSGCSPDIISNKKNIIKILHNFFYPNFHGDLFQNKPLLSPKVNIDLLCHILEFVKSDELIDEKDEDDRTVLYTAAEYLPTQHYQQLLETLANKHGNALKILLKLHDDLNQTPLQYLIRHLDVTKEILDIFHQNGADMYSSDSTGYNILWNSVRHKRSLQVIQDLLEYTENQSDKYKRNALHIAAQHAKDNDIVAYLISKGFSVDSKDCFGNTPIFYAVRNRNPLTDLQLSTLLVSLKPSSLGSRVNLKKESLVDLARKLENVQAQNVLRQLGY